MKDTKNKIILDPNFINIKRFDFSMDTLLQRYPDGAPDKVVASALMMTEEEVADFYEGVVEKLRSIMGVKNE